MQSSCRAGKMKRLLMMGNHIFPLGGKCQQLNINFSEFLCYSFKDHVVPKCWFHFSYPYKEKMVPCACLIKLLLCQWDTTDMKHSEFWDSILSYICTFGKRVKRNCCQPDCSVRVMWSFAMTK